MLRRWWYRRQRRPYRIRLTWDLQTVAEGTVFGMPHGRSVIVFQEPNTDLRISRDAIATFSGPDGMPISVQATRWAVEFEPIK